MAEQSGQIDPHRPDGMCIIRAGLYDGVALYAVVFNNSNQSSVATGVLNIVFVGIEQMFRVAIPIPILRPREEYLAFVTSNPAVGNMPASLSTNTLTSLPSNWTSYKGKFRATFELLPRSDGADPHNLRYLVTDTQLQLVEGNRYPDLFETDADGK